MLRLAVIPIALLALLAGAVVWTNKGEGPPADFTYNIRGENKTLDLGVMSWQQDMRVAYALYEGLYTCDPKTLQPIPGSAFAPEVNKEQTVYTFRLRPEAKWSNGDDLTAGGLLSSPGGRMIEQPAEYSYLFANLKGAKEYEVASLSGRMIWRPGRRRRPPEFKMVGVEALDRKTLKVTLAQPVVYFLFAVRVPRRFFPQHERACGLMRRRMTAGRMWHHTISVYPARRTWWAMAHTGWRSGASSGACAWKPMNFTGTRRTCRAG